MSFRALGLGPTLRRATFVSKARPQLKIAKRFITIQSSPETNAILNKQRLLRPTSPHTFIYRWPIAAICSIGHRATGIALSVLLYGFSLGYLVSPDTFTSFNLVEKVKALPSTVKTATKAVLAAPFVYHSLNGVRHLVWDLGPSTSWVILALTAVGTGALTVY
ncbi:succinate dehydrogenase cytochrome b560 subunit [Flagelloscypha sp. PMI_526]|nr:succinate dehydrogenase cytochrome b560 subunit [Flagelloscypha sp. PMI_526]